MANLTHCEKCGCLPYFVILMVNVPGATTRYRVECKCGRMTFNYEKKALAVTEWGIIQLEARQQRFLGEG